MARDHELLDLLGALVSSTLASTCPRRPSASSSNTPTSALGSRPQNSKTLIDQGADLVILDSRPIEEFRNMSIPTAVDCPGAELVHRVKALAPDPDTLVVVNCAAVTFVPYR